MINKGDGVIFESPINSSPVRQPEWAIPAVAVQASSLGERYPLVSTDYEAVGRRAVQYFAGKGLTKLAYVSYARGDLAEAGLMEEARRRGYAVTPYYLGPQKPELDESDQRQLVGWLGELPPPVGILVQSDFLAQKIMDWIPQEWLPDRLAILGVGNDSIICPMTRPALSSIDRNSREIGRRAAEMLARMMDGEVIKPGATLLEPGEVIERQSTGLRYTPDPLVTRAMQYLDEHLAEAPSTEELCERMNVSRSTLDQHFLATLGCSIAKQRQRLQIERAKYLLKTTLEPMSRVAEHSGFANQQRLAEVFKRQVGISPLHYRAKG